MNLESPNTRREVQDSRNPLTADELEKMLHHETQLDIQLFGPNLNEQIGIPGGAYHPGRIIIAHTLGEYARTPFRRIVHQQDFGQPVIDPLGIEAQSVAGTQLTQFPELPVGHHRGTEKTAQGRAVGPENDGHIPGEVDGTDGIGIIVDIRGMKPRLPAVVPGPPGFRTDKADTRSIAVMIHPPEGIGEGFQVFGTKVGGVPLGSPKNTQNPRPPPCNMRRPRSRPPPPHPQPPRNSAGKHPPGLLLPILLPIQPRIRL